MCISSLEHGDPKTRNSGLEVFALGLGLRFQGLEWLRGGPRAL